MRFLAILSFAFLSACATPAPTKGDLEDVERLISAIEAGGECSAATSITAYDDELFIKMIGADLVKEGVPKTTNARQAEFYRLALETKTIPKGKDKEAILRALSMQSQERCRSFMFSFNNQKIRDAMAGWYVRAVTTMDGVRNDKLTYQQISSAMAQDDMANYLSVVSPVLQQDPALVNRLQIALLPILERMEALYERYDIDPESIK